ncbi:tetratricopeptide repeat protein [Streptomyces spectabilis]|uniref:Tetratricopeptide repeat protein n=1 Tax=Streptomyces spectabilis TaxID=68270 RepID=A0A516R838_STRST|nr:tetratricopeptide repeat protein [Streptomyces spectabilis]QDQ11811.1 tetratricopeptide repeat protein [Streptomyces spectabilis]
METEKRSASEDPAEGPAETPAEAPALGPAASVARLLDGLAEERRPRRRGLRWGLVAGVAGAVVLGGVLVLVPRSGERAAPPAPGPAGRALAAAGTGVPASLPDLAALIGEREAHLRAHPGDDQSWAVLGSAYVERGARTGDFMSYPKAEHALRTSLKARPEGNVDALAGLAALADARHDYRAARTWGERAARLAPKRWTTYPVLVEAYRGLGDAKGVARSLETLQKLRSGAAVRALAGTVYRDRGWRENAAAALADAAALAEGPAERAAGLYRVGELAWERGEPAQALRYFDAALAAEPGHHPSLAGKGRALAALGRTSEALQAYRSALAKWPEPRYALELGELYESLKLMPAARAQYDLLRARVRDARRGGVNDERVLGLFEADHGDAGAAVLRLRAEFARHGSPENADALGWALHRAGDSEAGLELAERAMKKGPRSAAFAFHRGEIERELGRYGAARRHLTEALRVNPYFSPLGSAAARRALEALGDPPDGGPAQVYAPPGAPVPELPTPRRTRAPR